MLPYKDRLATRQADSGCFVFLQDCQTSPCSSSTRPSCVRVGETGLVHTGIVRCSSSSAAISSVPTATWSWADGSPPSAGWKLIKSASSLYAKDEHEQRFLSQQRDRTLADGCVASASSAGRTEMYPDHEDRPVVDALGRLPQPEVQHRQSDKYLTSTTAARHVTTLFYCNRCFILQMMGVRCSAPSE